MMTKLSTIFYLQSTFYSIQFFKHLKLCNKRNQNKKKTEISPAEQHFH